MKKIIRILNLDIHSLNNAEYKNFMERFFKLIPLKAVSGEGDRPSELRLLGEEENMTSDFVGISDEDKATFNADMLLLMSSTSRARTTTRLYCSISTSVVIRWFHSSSTRPPSDVKVRILHMHKHASACIIS